MIKKTLTLTKSKECKHSVVYESSPNEKDSCIRSLYLMRSFSNPMPSLIEVTIKDQSNFTGVPGVDQTLEKGDQR